MGVVSLSAWGSTIRFPGGLGGGGGCLRSFPQANSSFRVGGGGGGGCLRSFPKPMVSTTAQERPLSTVFVPAKMVSTPVEVHPLSTVSMPRNGKHTSSRAPSQHCIHPAQHCVHASQMVSTPGKDGRFQRAVRTALNS